MIAARIARRLVRKLAKPAALWWTGQQLRRSEMLADHYHSLRNELVPLERQERVHAVRLVARRNRIHNW
jgi:hypothetical protein